MKIMTQSDFSPATKNQHMRRMAYFSLAVISWLTVDGIATGEYAPEYVYLAFVGLIVAWAGFSKWGEIKGA